MGDETGERDDVTVDEQGAIVNDIGFMVQGTADEAQIAKERTSYEAWQKARGMR